MKRIILIAALLVASMLAIWPGYAIVSYVGPFAVRYVADLVDCQIYGTGSSYCRGDEGPHR